MNHEKINIQSINVAGVSAPSIYKYARVVSFSENGAKVVGQSVPLHRLTPSQAARAIDTTL